MVEEHARRTIKYLAVVVPLLIAPLGMLLGTLLSVISDFGLNHTADTIRLNPVTFADQYATSVVRNGWAAAAIMILLALTAVCWYSCGSRGGNRPTGHSES